MPRAEDEERERGILEGQVKAYDAGLQIDLRGVAVPELDIRLIRKRDIAAIKPVLDSLSNYGIPMYDLDIRYIPKVGRELPGPGFFKLEQFIDGHRVGFLRLASIKEGGYDPRSHITGLLINPHLPQLNRKNWMPEKNAINMATDVLMRDVKSDGTSDWFLALVREGKLAGELQLKVGSSEEGISVYPIYSLTNAYTTVRINLYDGSMDTFENSPFN